MEIKVYGAAVHDCMECAAKNNVRYYLNGLHIAGSAITGTNGHLLLSVENAVDLEDEYNGKPIIIRLDKKPPKRNKTYYVLIDTEALTIKGFDVDSALIWAQTITIIDGRYHDFEFMLREPVNPTPITEITVAPNYLQTVGKVFQPVTSVKNPYVTLKFSTSTSGIVISSDHMKGYRMTLMPMDMSKRQVAYDWPGIHKQASNMNNQNNTRGIDLSQPAPISLGGFGWAAPDEPYIFDSRAYAPPMMTDAEASADIIQTQGLDEIDLEVIAKSPLTSAADKLAAHKAIMDLRQIDMFEQINEWET